MSELEQKLEGICFYEQPIFLIDAAEKEEKRSSGANYYLEKLVERIVSPQCYIRNTCVMMHQI